MPVRPSSVTQLDQHGLERVRAVAAAPPARAVGALLRHGDGRRAQLGDLHRRLRNTRGGPGEIARAARRDAGRRDGRRRSAPGRARGRRAGRRTRRGRGRRAAISVPGPSVSAAAVSASSRSHVAADSARNARGRGGVHDRLVPGQQQLAPAAPASRATVARYVAGGAYIGGDVGVALPVGDRRGPWRRRRPPARRRRPARRRCGPGCGRASRAASRERPPRSIVSPSVAGSGASNGSPNRLTARSCISLRERHVVGRGEPRVALADRALGHAHQRHVAGAAPRPATRDSAASTSAVPATWSPSGCVSSTIGGTPSRSSTGRMPSAGEPGRPVSTTSAARVAADHDLADDARAVRLLAREHPVGHLADDRAGHRDTSSRTSATSVRRVVAGAASPDRPGRGEPHQVGHVVRLQRAERIRPSA